MNICDKFVKQGAKAAAFAAICAAALALPALADPVQIDPEDYKYTFSITFNGYAGTTTLTNFPALVRLSPARNAFNYSICTNGVSLRFADADGNLLAHEIDTWNPDGESFVWVKVPLLNSSTVINAYYGYQGDGNPPAVTASDVWDNGFVGVWHLGESGLTLVDSTANGLNFSCVENHTNYVGRGVENGAVGKSVEFGLNGSSAGVLSADDSDLLDGFRTVTFEYWTYQTTHPSERGMTILKKQGTENSAFRFYENANDPRTIVGFELDGHSGSWWANAAKGSGTLPVEQWNHQAYTYNWQHSATKSGSYGYLNGSQIAYRGSNDVHFTFLSNDGKLSLGNDNATGKNAYIGRIDEVRISNVARSADWVKASCGTVSNGEFAVYQVPNDWSKYSHSFTVSFPGATNGVLSSFPVLVKISESSISGFRYADCLKEKGGDLRFSDASGNLLDSEVDIWNANGESLVWVNVPALDANTTIKAYYGWNLAPSVDSMNVWSNGFVGVWHLDEASLPVKDSTANPADFTSDKTGVLYNQTGIVGSSVRFHNGETATNSYLKADEEVTGKLDGFAAVTFEAWTCQYWHKVAPAYSGFILAKDKGSSANSYKIYEDTAAGNDSKRFMQISGNRNATSAKGLVPFSADEDIWNYQVFSFDSNSAATKKAAYYLNGVLNNTSDIGSDPLPSTTSPLYLGNMHGFSRHGYAFPGKIDEVRISNVARSAEWLATTYDMIKGNEDFARYGSARTQGKGFSLFVR